MLPCPQSRPEHLAARSAGLGALLGAGLLLWHGHGWAEVGALLEDKLRRRQPRQHNVERR